MPVGYPPRTPCVAKLRALISEPISPIIGADPTFKTRVGADFAVFRHRHPSSNTAYFEDGEEESCLASSRLRFWYICQVL